MAEKTTEELVVEVIEHIKNRNYGVAEATASMLQSKIILENATLEEEFKDNNEIHDEVRAQRDAMIKENARLKMCLKNIKDIQEHLKEILFI